MRKPKNFTDEMNALKEKADELRRESVRKLGELAVATGARDLPPEIVAGCLLDLVGRHRDDPASVAHFADSGAALFRGSSRRRRGNGRVAPAPAGGGAGAPGPAPDAAPDGLGLGPAQAG